MSRITIYESISRLVCEYSSGEDLINAAEGLAWELTTVEHTRHTQAQVMTEQFRGVFADIFTNAVTCSGHEVTRFNTELTMVSSGIERVMNSAVAETRRRDDGIGWQKRERTRQATLTGAPLTTAQSRDPAPPSPRPAPVVTAPWVGVSRIEFPAPGSIRHPGHRVVSACPEQLRAFTTLLRTCDTEITRRVTTLATAQEHFTRTFPWGRVDTTPVVHSVQQWLDRNRCEYAWLETIATQFEKAGDTPGTAPSGTVITLQLVRSRNTTALRPLTPEELLDLLTTHTPEQLAALLAANPNLAQTFWDTPPDPTRVNTWWSALTPTQQAAYLRLTPAIIGNLPGIPYTDRDTANRTLLNDWLQRHKNHTLTPEQNTALTTLQQTLNRKPIPGNAPILLLAFNMTATVPMIAVAYGNPDTTDTTTWCVPGMGSDASQALDSWSTACINLLNAQNDLDRTRTHSVISWLCYDTPSTSNLTQVIASDLARTGATRLAAELDGNHAVRVGTTTTPPPPISVIAHSYGTTTAADALTTTRYPISSLTMIGSAGIDTTTVPTLTGLHVTRDATGNPAIYTTKASADRLAPLGTLTRSDPNPGALTPNPITGAQSFSSEGTRTLTRVQGHGTLGENHTGPDPLNITPPPGHGYFDDRTESLKNMAATSLGQPHNVEGGLHPTNTNRLKTTLTDITTTLTDITLRGTPHP